MSIVLIPSMENTAPLNVPESPFHRLTTLPRSELASTRNVPAAERRLLTEHFVSTFQWETHPLLPLHLETVPDVRPWRSRICRSHYAWLPPDDIQSAADLEGMDDFDLLIRLFDFSPWRPIPSASSGQAWDSDSPVALVLPPSIPSVSAWPGSWPAGGAGLVPAW
jgi:hypothetical protein